MAELEAVELADVVALLAAHVRGDEKACQELLTALGVADGVVLLGYAIEVAVEVASQVMPGGRPALLAWLSDWQERRREGLLG